MIWHDNHMRARALLASAFEVPENDIGLDASMENSPQWDSLGHVKLIMRIEDDLGRKLESEEVVDLFDLNSVADLLSNSAQGSSK